MNVAPPVIGLAGGIGSGKSAVAKILRDLGAVVSDSDEGARLALRDRAIKADLVRWWGDEILDADGAVDRRRVAHIVFADPLQRRRLEALTHPWIEKRRLAEFAAAPAGAMALVIDAPLLFEAGLDRICDAVIFVDAPRELRLERVRAARGWSESDLDRRETSQMPLDEKRARADHVICNSGDLAGLAEQTRRVLHTIVETARA